MNFKKFKKKKKKKKKPWSTHVGHAIRLGQYKKSWVLKFIVASSDYFLFVPSDSLN